MDLNGYNVDSTATPAIGAHISELGSETNAGIASQYGSGIPTARGLLNSDSGLSSSMAYGDKATSDAIKARYSMPYMRKENELRVDVMKNASADHIRNLQVASMAAGQEVEQNRQKAILKWKVEQANKRARGAVYGSVLGIVGGIAGGVAGGMAGGGAPGAMVGIGAGQALGSGVGQAIGGGL